MSALPFVKVAGGKRRLASKILSLFPKSFGTYHEPFLGGGAVFFALGSSRAVLSDANSKLVEAYRAVRDEPGWVLSAAAKLLDRPEVYEEARARNCECGTREQRAADFLYLNKTCFNGLWRVNSKGRFNVPYGHRGLAFPVLDEATIFAASRALRGVPILNDDYHSMFERGCGWPLKGDVVYFDPPYVPTSKTSSFVGYTKEGFGDSDQESLAGFAEYLKGAGIHVVLSASDAPWVRALYPESVWTIEEVSTRRSIGASASTRKRVGELLIY